MVYKYFKINNTYFYNFRQISPSTNKAVCDRLSAEANNLNLKKVQVNSQITALISFLEVCGAIVGLILVYTLADYNITGIVVILNNLLFYFIVLPSTFLLNTSDNKTRIIEDGWNNVLRSLFGVVSSHSVELNQVIPNNRISEECSNESGQKAQNNTENEMKIFTTRSSAEQGKSRNDLETLSVTSNFSDAEEAACHPNNEAIPSTSH